MNSQSDTRPEPKRQTLRLLYVEDNPQDADLFRDYFGEHAPEFDVEIVDTGQKCLERLREGAFDLLLLDYCLPDMDGMEVLAEQNRVSRQIPTVLVSVENDEDLVVRALRLGADNYAPKRGRYLETLPGLLHSTLEERRRKQSLGLLAATEPRRILYVEHDPMDTEQILSHFTKTAPNFVVEVVQTCAAALECLIQPQPFDLLLIELRMPDQNVLGFLREARGCGLRLPPIIIVSVQGDDTVALAAMKLGAADYICKREGYLEQLTSRINDAIAHDRRNHRLNEQLLTELAARKLAEENLRQHQIELELQNQELKKSQRALETLRKRYFDLYDQAPVGYCTVSKQGLIIEANSNAASLLGVAPGALIKKMFTGLILKEDADNYYLLCKQLLETGEPKSLDLRMVKHDGTQIWAHLVIKIMPDEEGASMLLVALSDVTEHKQAEEKLQVAASVFTCTHEGIMITNEEGEIIDANEAFCNITGYSRDETIGQNPRILKSNRQDNEFYAEMWRELIEKGHWSGEIWNRRKNGEVYPEQLTISAVRDAQGNCQRYVALFSDISSLKEQQSQLEHLAHYDALTNLPNRLLLGDRLRQGMAQALRRGELLAVAYLDLDDFKSINDNYGHEVGDQLLKAVATRMKRGLREGDTLTRLGGDEFVAVLVGLADVAASIPMLNRLLAAAAQPIPVADLTLRVSASLGVTFYPQAEDIEADHLLRQADQAMYQAKLAGRNRYHIFDTVQDHSIRSHLQDIEIMRRALTGREFVLYYQPKVNVRTGAVVGVEALIRWQHPEKGLLYPAEFLPVIEGHPLAVEFGEWVIDGALTQMEHWQAAGLDIPVSVNVNAYHLQQPVFVERLRGLLAAHPKIRPGDLQMEVLETKALEDLDRVTQVIEAC
ncbi:MAG: diguanylate cyclase, partial [Methylococcales bacterium]|nr:diguanylate cyclase [Methylococcales bacterium]